MAPEIQYKPKGFIPGFLTSDQPKPPACNVQADLQRNKTGQETALQAQDVPGSSGSVGVPDYTSSGQQRSFAGLGWLTAAKLDSVFRRKSSAGNEEATTAKSFSKCSTHNAKGSSEQAPLDLSNTQKNKP